MQYGKKHHIDVNARAAGAIIYNEQHEFLLIKELHGSKKGLWHIPSGSMEAGEFPVDTARREIAEETGLQLTLSNFLNTYVGCFDDGELVLRHVWIESYPTDQTLAPQLTDEIEAARFFTVDNIRDMYESNQLRMHHTLLIVEDAHRYLSADRNSPV